MRPSGVPLPIQWSPRCRTSERGSLGGDPYVPRAPCAQNPHKGEDKFNALAESLARRQAAGRRNPNGERRPVRGLRFAL
jgi:hypothetical protein